ncbi:hypothetical protein [uncultured Flavobacterium sp.]|uniref:hypothetical protein n=1 Tax=uncultured Flavobacterium sp. TaxID=165435 RepID=UPI00259422AA|nr:hypothetical protein [uncultured Flavobacterium sp.]
MERQLPYKFTDFLIYNSIIAEVENTFLQDLELEVIDYLKNKDSLNIFMTVTKVIFYKGYLEELIIACNGLDGKFHFRTDWPAKKIIKSLEYSLSVSEKILLLLERPVQELTKDWSEKKRVEQTKEVLKNPQVYKWAGLI